VEFVFDFWQEQRVFSSPPVSNPRSVR